jgi:hypothetical protein
MMIPSMLEKFAYGTTLMVLYLQNRLHLQDLALGGVDILFGVLFLAAFLKTGG